MNKAGFYVNERAKQFCVPFYFTITALIIFEEGLARFVAKGKMGFHDQSLKNLDSGPLRFCLFLLWMAKPRSAWIASSFHTVNIIQFTASTGEIFPIL